MKIAVTYENGQIFQHFGHTEKFKVYETEGNKILSSEVIDTAGSGHGALAGFLLNNDVAVADYLVGRLNSNPDVMCRHHDEHHGSEGICGQGSCGSHKCH